MRILLIKNNDTLAKALCTHLRVAGHRVDAVAADYEAAFLWAAEHPDAVLLDLSPASDDADASQPLVRQRGLHILDDARARGEHAPVLVLTDALPDGEANGDAVEWLRAPVDPFEVERRLGRLVQRAHAAGQVLSIGDLRLNLTPNRFFLRGTELALTAPEFHLLRELMLHQGHVVADAQLLQHLGTDASRSQLDAVIYRLRRRLADSGAALRTVRAQGHLLEADHVRFD